MEDKQSRILISISEGKIEIEGAQEFVEKQLEVFKKHIDASLTKISTTGVVTPPPPPQTPGKKPAASEAQVINAAGLANYSNLFAKTDDDKIQILKTVPGNGTREKMANVSILAALAYKLMGVDSVSYETGRDLCHAQSCLDPGNFAKAIKKNAKLYLVSSGKASSQSFSLSVPGQAHATAMATALNNS